MVDLGPVEVVLGMQVSCNRSSLSLTLTQEHYVRTLLDTYHMSNYKSVATPMEPGMTLTPANNESAAEFALTGENVWQAFGCLEYLVQCTRPDLAFTVSQLAQHLEVPSMDNLMAFKRVLRYSKQTLEYKIQYQGHVDVPLTGNLTHSLPRLYTDADWPGESKTQQSTSGYVFTLFRGAVSWHSKKQPVVSLSTTKAEYKSTVKPRQELAWLEVIGADLQAPLSRPITFFKNNQGAIALENNPVFFSRKNTTHWNTISLDTREGSGWDFQVSLRIHPWYDCWYLYKNPTTCVKWVFLYRIRSVGLKLMDLMTFWSRGGGGYYKDFNIVCF